MAFPKEVLMCPPDHFDVVDVKNAFMTNQVGRVDKAKAREQWNRLKQVFESIGLKVHTIAPEPGLEDMVFCANQTFVGPDASGVRTCVLSHMRFGSRQREVPAFGEWFATHGYRIETLGDPTITFEGGGDAIWHPGKAMIWGGIGPRTDAKAYNHLAQIFGVPVLTLELKAPFYHLDTCFAALDQNTVLIHPPAFTEPSRARIEKYFPRVIEATPLEALDQMACNAAAFFGKYVVIHDGAMETGERLKQAGFKVIPVDTTEFKRAGGSVFCLKMAIY